MSSSEGLSSIRVTIERPVGDQGAYEVIEVHHLDRGDYAFVVTPPGTISNVRRFKNGTETVTMKGLLLKK